MSAPAPVDGVDYQKVPCSRCSGRGWYEGMGANYDCKACNGSGHIGILPVGATVDASCSCGAKLNVSGSAEAVIAAVEAWHRAHVVCRLAEFRSINPK